MSPVAGNILIDLRRFHLLEPEQFDELTRTITQFPSEPKALAQELMHRGWLTPFQVNHLLQGRGQDLVLGSYVLLERLGEGGMGEVFKARNWKLGAVAPSRSSARTASTRRDAVQRFHREMRAAAQLSHPNIVQAYDADEVDGTHFFAMELVDGVGPGAARRGQRPAAGGPGLRLRPPGGAGPAARPRARPGPPRHQAVQPAADAPTGWSKSSTWAWPGWRRPATASPAAR